MHKSTAVGKDLILEDLRTAIGAQREQFYFQVKPLLEQVLAFAHANETGLLVIAGT